MRSKQTASDMAMGSRTKCRVPQTPPAIGAPFGFVLRAGVTCLRLLMVIDQFLLDLQGFGDGLLNRFPKHAEVSHFPAGTALQLSVQVKFCVGVTQYWLPIGLQLCFPKVAEQVDHDDRSEKVRRPKGQSA